MRQRPEVTLAVPLVRGGVPLVAQLTEGLRERCASGLLAPGEAVPSTRALAAHLGVSRGTVAAAYDQLLAEGWFDATPGSATRVNPRVTDLHPPAPALPRAERPRPATPAIDLRPGRPATGDLLGPAWRAAWRRAGDAPVADRVPLLGWEPLRAAIADHLRRLRGVVVEPARIAVTAGGREGLALLLLATGARSVGVEEPGFGSLRRVLTRHGVAPCPLPADERGLVTASLPEVNPPDALVVTPSHQYPLGGSLPIDRRRALLAWADRHGALVVEDDYDSELRYTSEPLPALAALAADRVALLGTFSKTLTPALATGYVVLPDGLVAEAEAVRRDLGSPVSLVTQAALAHYLGSGDLARHTQRMRRLYRRRRALVVDALGGIPGVRVAPMHGGLHAVVTFDADEDAVLDRLARRGVAVTRLSDYWAAGPTRARRGLVFGFAEASDADLATGLAAIREAVSPRP